MKKLILIGVTLLTVIQLAFCQLNPIKMGNATNPWTIMDEEQNQVYADNETGLLVFIHRQDINIHGGNAAENGKLRYDISFDRGQTFRNNLGLLNPNYLIPARYPQVTGYNPLASSNSFDVQLIWTAPTIQGVWGGIANGMFSADTVATTTQEEYGFSGHQGSLGGLCHRKNNEVWVSTMDLGDDSLRIYKGIIDSNQVSWMVDTALKPLHRLQGGVTHNTNSNMAFSPSGDTGWVVFLGDLVGGQNRNYTPIVLPTFDGGNTWGPLQELNLNTMNYESFTGQTLQEDLTSFWTTIDQPTGDTIPLGSGIPALAFKFDLTVDMNGTPHIFTIVMNKHADYQVTSFYEMFLIDIYSEDGGANWSAKRISTIYTWRNWFGPSGSNLLHDNYLQVSRTPDGSRIFYSWLDSDTAITGFGNPRNKEHNLRIASQRISDGYLTCVKKIEDQSSIFHTELFFPAMAPEVFVDSGNTTYHLPIVAATLDTTLATNSPTEFWYLGNDAVIYESDYMNTASMFNANGCASNVGISEFQIIPFEIWPNPSNGMLHLKLPDGRLEYRLEIVNMLGQIVYKTKVKGSQITIDLSKIQSGTYSISLQSNGRKSSKRWVKI